MIRTPFAARITGTGSAYPAGIVTNDDLAKRVETNDAWIRERTGIRERRVADQVRNPDEQNSSLGMKAALKALERAGKKPEDIDQIIYGTCSPDTIVPSTACWLQKKIGAVNASAIDLNAACSGFLYSLYYANNTISMGQAKTILVVGAEVLNPYVNWDDRTTCILFGDGAGAAVVEQVPFETENKLYSVHIGANGNLWDLFYVPAGGSNLPVTHEVLDRNEHKMLMKGTEIFKVAVKTLSDYALKALEANQVDPHQLAWVVPHQANLRIIEAVARRLDISMDRFIVNVDRHGNTSAATVPTALDEAVRDGRIKRGDWVLLDVFGAGLTYGSALLKWN